jgi:hypothetical protein
MNFSELLITSIKSEIELLEIELNYIHNNDSISPIDKINKIKDILKKISEKKNILSLYINYILESKQNEHNDNIPE